MFCRYSVSICLLITLVICDNLENKFAFNIIHTSDLHSQFAGTGPDIDTVRGHYARLKYMIENLQKANDPKVTLTLDAGDWFSGSLFHLISVSKFYDELGAIELKFLSDCKYDATTLGNHEFDPTEKGLFHLLNKTQNKLINKLPIVVSNIHLVGQECDYFNKVVHAPEETFSNPVASLENSNNQSPSIVPFVLKELTDTRGNILKVGIIGSFGIDANKVSTAYRSCLKFDGNDFEGSTSFDDYVKVIHDTASMLRGKYNVHVIVLLAHGGEPEDHQVMEALEGLNTQEFPVVDVHISSHTHHVYMVMAAKYVIHQAGPYAENIGLLQFEYDFEKKFITRLLNENVKEPVGDFFSEDWFTKTNLFPVRIPITKQIPKDKAYDDLISTYRDYIDAVFLSKIPWKYSTQIGYMPTNFDNNLELTQYINDCILDQTNKALVRSNKDVAPLDMFLMAVAGIRVEAPALREMNQTGSQVLFQFSDAYRMVGIGYLGTDVSSTSLPGDTVAHFYMTKFEMYGLITITSLIDQFSPIKDQYTMCVTSGVSYKVNKWGIPFLNNRYIGRIYDFHINGIPYSELPAFIHIGVPGWLTRFFDRAQDFTFGIFSMPYRNQQGDRVNSAMQTKLHDYILLSQCVTEHTVKRDWSTLAEEAKAKAREMTSWSDLTEDSYTEEAVAAGVPSAHPDNL
ncbi:5NTD [Acrasis kona]|uniref:5NTD n=1 Tax=Acrasis kona TaxID=1008807 RepID=A0AAW2ZKV3_9EUKA